MCQNITNEAGIYKIQNLVNGKIYIGSAINLHIRFHNHWNSLRQHKHRNKHLQASWDKYGEENFTFEVLEIIEKEQLLRYIEEQYIQDTQCYKPNIGYNVLAKTNKIQQKINCINSQNKMSKLRDNLGLPKSYALNQVKAYKRYLNRYGLHYVPKALRQKWPNASDKELAFLNLQQVKNRYRQQRLKDCYADNIYLIFKQYENNFVNKHKQYELVEHKHLSKQQIRTINNAYNDKLQDDELVTITRDGCAVKPKCKLTAAGRRKLVESKLGTKLSEEARLKISQKRKGCKLTAEHRQRMKEARKGSNNANSKLSIQQVLDISHKLDNGCLPRQISKQYNICVTLVYMIRNKNHWVFKNEQTN